MLIRARQFLRCDLCKGAIKPKDIYFSSRGTNRCLKCYLTMDTIPQNRGKGGHWLSDEGEVSLSLENFGIRCDIRVTSDRFTRCNFCGKAIKPKEEYLWDPDNNLKMCLDCDWGLTESRLEHLSDFPL